MAKQKTHEEFMEEFYEKGNKNIIILGKYINSTTKILVKCKIDGYEWEAYPGNLLKGKGCPVCTGQVVVPHINSVAILRPDLVKYFKDPEDAYNTMPGSHTEVTLKCPDCGAIRKMIMYNLSIQGFVCLECSLNISYPNRLIRSIMDQLFAQLDYLEYEWSEKWTNRQRYDVYFEKNNKKYVIEMQGEQHYGAGWNRDIPLEQIEDRDNKKAELAMTHDIIPIIIDSRISDFDFIFHNIKNSILSNIFDLCVIDIMKCKNYCTKNIVKEVCIEYNNNPDMPIVSFVKKYKLNRKTIKKYLTQGSKFNWCDYNPRESYQKSRDRLKKSVNVYSLNNEYVNNYNSLTSCASDLSKNYNINFFPGEIIKACKIGKPYHDLYFEYA